jgi:hypothetical protein
VKGLDFAVIIITNLEERMRSLTKQQGGCMSTPLYSLRAKNVATTIATLKGMLRSKKTKEVKAIEKIILELELKFHSLKSEKK